MKRLLKTLLYILLSLILIVGIGAYVLRNYLQDIILHRLQTELETTFDDYYHLDFASIHTSIVDGTFGIKIIHPVFSTDTSEKQYLAKYPAVYFKADSIEIGGLNIERLFISQAIRFDFISLSNPELTFLLQKHPKTKNAEIKVTKPRKIIEQIVFNEMRIEKGNVSVLHLKNPSDTLYYGEKINIVFNDTRVPLHAPEGVYTASKIGNILFEMSNVRFYPEKSPYSFLMQELKFNAQHNTLHCRKVNMHPEKSLLEMSTGSRFQKTFANIQIGNILLRGIDYAKLGEPALEVQYAEITHSNFNLLRNKNQLLNKSQHQKTWQENLKAVKFPIKIDTLHFNNIHLNISVHFPNHPKPVVIKLHHMKGNLLNINNDSTSKTPMILHANSTIMQSGKLFFDASFPIYNQNHTYKAHITNMPFAEWNPVISRIANVELTSGNIKHISLTGNATAMETNGTILFEYRDLQATIFKKTQNGKLKKAKGLTYLANGFLRLHNPDKGETTPVSKQYYFKREPWQGQIMLWIGGLIDGIEATLLNERLKRKVDDVEAETLKRRRK